MSQLIMVEARQELPVLAQEETRIQRRLHSWVIWVSQLPKHERCAGDVNRALDWVFSHPDDPGESSVTPAEADSSSTAPQAPIAGLADLPARFELQSIVCHKGGSIHAGHYVAFVRKEIPGEEGKGWVLFNDEKVVKALDVDEMKRFAYIYFFTRV